MTRKNESILNLLSKSPWWVSVVLSGISYIVLKFIIPSIKVQQDLNHALYYGLIKAAPTLAPFVAFFLLIPAPISLFNSIRKRKLLDKQKSIDTVRSLNWKEFEELIGEAYRRQGFTVYENSNTGPDGGIDLRLKKDGDLVVVQCKQWRNIKVGVDKVRELYGVQIAERANRSILITSGYFTQEAKNFASNKSIDLVDGSHLLEFIKNVQFGQSGPKVAVPVGAKNFIGCPVCGSGMVLRTAHKGPNPGQQFWGCSKFPACRGTKKFEG
jgi:restriction system protein